MKNLFLILLFPWYVLAQDCVYQKEVISAAGYRLIDSIQVIEGDLFWIDFSTDQAPDQLVIYAPTDTLKFHVGGGLTSQTPNYYPGYAETYYSNDTLIVLKKGASLPLDFFDYVNQDFVKGTLRVIYQVPRYQCKLKFEIKGNPNSLTWFEVCFRKVESGIRIVDTVFVDVCGKKSTQVDSTECYSTVTVFRDSSINPRIFLKSPSCPSSSDGSIRFDSKYSNFNQYGLLQGIHLIEIFNSICIDTIKVELIADDDCVEIFIPNIFRESFDISGSDTEEYNLEIYDRWGGLLHRSSYLTNSIGWTPDSKIQPDVYIYQVRYKNKLYSGSVTKVD